LDKYLFTIRSPLAIASRAMRFLSAALV
jgi:CopC domain